jgi:hypothetical protein
MTKKKFIFLFFLLLGFLAYFLVMLFHFNFYVLPASLLLAGIAIRVIFKQEYLPVFSFLFPLVSAFAYWGNRGLPFNYFVLPLLLLSGIYAGELLLDRQKAFQVLNHVNRFYLLLLTIIFISVLFLIFKWSNLTLPAKAFFKDTPVAPTGIRLSFAIIFPLIYLFLFTASYVYFLYLKDRSHIKNIIFAFLWGHSLSIFLSYIQNIFQVKLFLWKPCNGFASDNSSFGFLSAVALLLSLYVYFNYKKKGYGLVFTLISILGILNSHTRIGLIAICFTVLYFLFNLKKRELLTFMLIFFVLAAAIYFSLSNPHVSGKLFFLKEMGKNFRNFQNYVIDGKKDPEIARKFLAGREQVWLYSARIIQKYPLIGVGTGNFIFWVMFDQYGKDYFHDLPGNEYLSFSSSTGIIGLLFFLGFLYSLGQNKTGLDKWLFFCILVILFFQSYFWFPESFLAFWLLSSLGESEKTSKMGTGKFVKVGCILLIGFFIGSNIYHFQSLHPRKWAGETHTDYDYGFWYEEKSPDGERFSWSKQKSGYFIYLNEQGKSAKLKLHCGAPPEILNTQGQKVDIFWKGKLYESVLFRENRDFVFFLKDLPSESGFVEFRINPVFNLKQMGISEESRDLGIQFSKPL